MNIKSKQILLGAIACLVCGTGTSPAAPIHVTWNVDGNGTFTPFYRNTQLQGYMVENGSMLQSIPTFLMNATVEFPYKGPGYGIPYVDHMSITRYMGGFLPAWAGKDQDLAFRNGNGTVVLRDGNGTVVLDGGNGTLVLQGSSDTTPDKIAARTADYIAAGYQGDSLTISVDNVPWDLARVDPVTGVVEPGAYGVSAPPTDWNEWYKTLYGICMHLKNDVYLGKLPEKIRFKMGTEYNTAKSFSGTQEDYFKFYDYSVKAIREVFPDAFVMPCEQGGGETAGTVNMLEFMDHVASGTNYATGGIGTPINGIARSLNCFGGDERDPRKRVWSASTTFAALTNQNPRFQRSDLSYELHQMGWINNEYGVKTNEPGVRGAVWYFDIISALKALNALDFSWHWGQIDFLSANGTKQYLPTTLGLLMQVLDSFEGMQWWVLDDPVVTNTSNGTFSQASLFIGDTNRYLLVTSYNIDRSLSGDGGYVDVKIPVSLLNLGSNPQLFCRSWHEDNTVYSQIRADLKAAGNLNANFSGNFTFGPVSAMSANATTGQQMVINNIATYQSRAQTMLKVNQSYTGNFTTNGTVQTLHFYMRDTSLAIIRL